jgi:hypothetical protein
MISVCLSTTSFTYDKRYYSQINGTAMGSPISTVVAEIVMRSFESWALPQIENRISLWRRYVDDIICFIKPDEVDNIKNLLNTYHRSLKFKLEMESDSKIPFLDISLKRSESGYVSTTVYVKPTGTSSYLNFDSYAPLSHKRSVVRTLTKRAHTHCSSHYLKLRELSRVKHILTEVGYPERFISNNSYRPPSAGSEPPNRLVPLYLPYSQIFEKLSRVFRRYGFVIRFSSAPKLRQILRHPSTKLPPAQATSLLYQIPCSNCSGVYTGETARTFQTRLSEHRSIYNKSQLTSMLASHCLDEDHIPDWDNGRVRMTGVKNSRHRLFIEGWYSSMQRKPLNKYERIPPEYLSILNR